MKYLSVFAVFSMILSIVYSQGNCYFFNHICVFLNISLDFHTLTPKIILNNFFRCSKDQSLRNILSY